MGFGAEDVACEGRCVVDGWPGRNCPLSSRSQKAGNARCPRQSERADGRFQGWIIRFFGKRRRYLCLQSRIFRSLQRFASSV